MTLSNRVPCREPLNEGEGPANFVAGWNTPGYLPEMEPAFFRYFDDAKRFILNALGEFEDELGVHGLDDLADTISGQRQDINLESADFSVEVDDGTTLNCAYWVEAC